MHWRSRLKGCIQYAGIARVTLIFMYNAEAVRVVEAVEE
jgi:hypothetical protein